MALLLFGSSSVENVSVQLITNSGASSSILARSNSEQISFLHIESNIFGISFDQFGDKQPDAFRDNFITPQAVSLNVCAILLYKSKDQGGPGPGSESVFNFDKVIFSMVDLSSESEMIKNHVGLGSICHQYKSIGTTIASDLNSEIKADLKAIGSEHDRIGLVLRSVTYFFSPTDVPDPEYRYVDLSTGVTISRASDGPFDTLERGIVSSLLFAGDCPAEWLETPGFLFTPSEKTLGGVGSSECRFRQSQIVSKVALRNGSVATGVNTQTLNPGSYLANQNEAELGTNIAWSPHPFYYPLGGGFLEDFEGQQFSGSRLNSQFESSGNLIRILPIQRNGSEPISRLHIGLRIDRVLFWDSNGDSVFAPRSDADDRSSFQLGVHPLHSSLKNVTYSLPGITATFSH